MIELARGRNIEKILEPLKMPAEEMECRFNILVPDFKEYGNMVINELKTYAQTKPEYKIADDNREGIRISTGSGFFLLRMSVHDPVMPMNFESDVPGGIKRDIEGLKGFFSRFEGLDTSSLEI